MTGVGRDFWRRTGYLVQIQCAERWCEVRPALDDYTLAVREKYSSGLQHLGTLLCKPMRRRERFGLLWRSQHSKEVWRCMGSKS
jgi:hypothetical protein